MCELPSQLMEYFLRDPRSLRRLLRHHRSGECMPMPLAQMAAASRRQFGALELQQQVHSPCTLLSQYLQSRPNYHCHCGQT